MRGIAVHIASRVAHIGGTDDVLVSRTVKDLVAGSRIKFEDFGMHTLKGIPEVWQVFRAVRPIPFVRRVPACTPRHPHARVTARSVQNRTLSGQGLGVQ